MSLRRRPENMLRNITRERNDVVEKLDKLKDECKKRVDFLEEKLRSAPNEKTRAAAEKEVLKERERCVKQLTQLVAKVEKMSENIETRTSKLTLAATRKNIKSVGVSLNANTALVNALALATANGLTKTRKARRTPEQIAINKAIEDAAKAAKIAAKAEEKAAKEAVIAEEKARKASEKAEVKATKEAKLAEAKALREAKEAEVKAAKEAATAAKAVAKVEKAVRMYPAYTKYISNSLKESGTKMKGHNVIRFVANFKKSHPNTYNTFKSSRAFNKTRIFSHLGNTRRNTKPYNPFNINNEEINFNLSNNNNNNKNTKPYNPFNEY